jgi:uncharacterized SAM-binding protein YcdF (DUF218 family)
MRFKRRKGEMKLSNLKKLFIFLGIINILYYVICISIFGANINFVGFFFCLGCIFIIAALIKDKINIKNNNKIFVIIKVLVSVILISFIFVETNIIYNSRTSLKTKPDYILVLGAGIRGKTMLLVQLQRTETALEYIKKYPEAKIIVSGGRGPGEDISEAEAMKEYLVKKGVNSDSIIKEEKSKNTIENMKYSHNILKNIDKRKNISVAVVTSNFHVFRAKFLAKRAGINAEGIAAPVNYILVPNYYVREYFGVIKSFFLDK